MLLISCTHKEEPVGRALYYWKSVFSLSDASQKKIDSLGITCLYVRYFDIQWDDINNQPKTIAPIRFSTKPGLPVQPVLYITNKTFRKLPISQCAELANYVVSEVDKINHYYAVADFRIMQTDCDWTNDTRVKYFAFLTKLNELLKKKNAFLTATIRLHQVKYWNITGVPPADRGILMFYNMGNLRNSDAKNTIFDEKTARTYLKNFDHYPLALDVALPFFDWLVVRRHHKPVLLLNNPDLETISANPKIRKINENNYMVTENTIYNYQYLYKNDQLHYEGVNAETCLEAARLIKPYLKSDSINVGIFSWNEKTFSATPAAALVAVYQVFP
jgi:hypothetical protein